MRHSRSRRWSRSSRHMPPMRHRTPCCSKSRRACAISAACRACSSACTRCWRRCSIASTASARRPRKAPPCCHGCIRASHCADLAALHPALDAAPVWLLGPGSEHWDALQGMGLRTLGDLRSVPRAGLARRFGVDLLNELDRARGAEPDPRVPIVLPPVFESRLELFARADTTEQVLHGREPAARPPRHLAVGAARLRAPLHLVDAARGASPRRRRGGARDDAGDRAGRAVARQRPPAGAAARASGAPAVAGADAGPRPARRRHRAPRRAQPGTLPDGHGTSAKA